MIRREWIAPALALLLALGAFGWWTHTQRMRGKADAYAAEARVARAHADTARAAARVWERRAHRDSVRADSLARVATERRETADAALDSLEVLSVGLEARLRPALPPAALPAYDSLIAAKDAQIDTLRSIIRQQDELAEATAAALASVRQQLRAEQEVNVRLTDLLRLRDRQIAALEQAAGAGLWDRAKWAGAGLAVGFIGHALIGG